MREKIRIRGFGGGEMKQKNMIIGFGDGEKRDEQALRFRRRREG